MKLCNFVKLMKKYSLSKLNEVSDYKSSENPDSELGRTIDFGNEVSYECFSSKGHDISFRDGAYMLLNYASSKDLLEFPVIEFGQPDKCDEGFIEAIIKVQEHLGLEADGVMGKLTVKAISRALKADLAPTVDEPDPSPSDTDTDASDVLFVGDSIATGLAVAYADRGMGYPECKGLWYGRCKTPTAKGGDASWQILAKLRKYFGNPSNTSTSSKKKTMIVTAGTNDALAYSGDTGNFTPEKTIANIDRIVSLGISNNYEVRVKIIDAWPPGKGFETYSRDKYEEFASEVNRDITSKYSTFSFGSNLPMSDPLHPTKQGSDALLDIALSGRKAPLPPPPKEKETDLEADVGEVPKIKQREILDDSRPGGKQVIVDFIEENTARVNDACMQILKSPFDFSTDGVKNFQKSVGFSGETRTFKTEKGARTIEGQIDGKIGPQTMTAITLVVLMSPNRQEENKLHPEKIFESSQFSLKERLESNLSYLKERTGEISFEKFANSKAFKSRVASVHSFMKVQNPSIPSFNQINFPFDGRALLEEKYEIHEGVGITKKYGEKKIKLIKIMIDQIKAGMPSDAHSPKAIIAILSVCAKESAFGPTKEGTRYRFDNIKAGATGDAVAGRVNYRFTQHPAGPGRPPTDEEIEAITGGGTNGIALFNIAYGYDPGLHGKNRIKNNVKVIVNDSINPALYDPELAGFKYRGHGAVQMTGRGNYETLERLANKQGGKVAKMFKGVADNPEIVIKTPEHNVISSIMYMNFQHARTAIGNAKQKEGETEMEFLIRKYASGPFGSTIGQKYYSRKHKKMVEPGPSRKINGQINLSAAANKSSKFIIVEE
tara:strand:- start:1892 stop:4390 length:2499 start_codon:yes stop_codon:yes gene_type:complete